MSLTLIAALDLDNGIGKENQLLWHLPDDFQHFKHLTMGHCVIMGRKTLESLPKLLPKRTHIVLSRDKNYQREHCIMVSSIQEAIAVAHKQDEHPFVIGGGEVYKLALPYATTLELTRVQAHFQADTFFPEIDLQVWQLVRQDFHPKDERHPHDFYFETYKLL
ncbi:dihydrofolate reductase [Capnocytophaga gingivalis]|uniref:Dihydrofolate reductase n=1 Tax=Capnocytophaga gingivalis TaxID=1017 RepID=A0ABU5Z5Q0_9FLAO|nr:dihydrofolate reductase [Capnocytophaga gingivalis]MEB3074235.1 dihydrofolate reductase [Capnocytophaga gingivalis]